MVREADSTNHEFNLAVDFVKDTSKSLFLTGKAGTGKTTFLKHIKNTTNKNTVIIAPTGVAAINAGGTTIHSFFQLPFGPFIPVSAGTINPHPDFADKHSIFKNIHFTSDKIDLLQELDLIIIDEISMVRCDVIDAIDTVMRHYRKQLYLPFGGVQVVFIGDLFQLPPVMPEREWKILSQYYQSPYFFSSEVIRQSPPLYLELKKIYRQNDQGFIGILNRVRNNEVDWEDLEILHKCYDPDFKTKGDAGYIMLSTHNKKVEAINAAELEKLATRLFKFKGSMKGEFQQKALPTEMELCLKEGAQVMFVKNDTEAIKRYYNGKLGIIKEISSGEITVEFTDTRREMILEKATWENISYDLNRETGEVEEKIEGTFTQYPVKLAWAITVHKSQGLTFEKAILDLGSSFAPGQVYVALSRCTSLDGLVLHSRIWRQSIMTDPTILEFAANWLKGSALKEILEEEKQSCKLNTIMSNFELTKLSKVFHQHLYNNKEKNDGYPAAGIDTAIKLYAEANRLEQVASHFRKELRKLLDECRQQEDSKLLETRLEAATKYFTDCIHLELLKPLDAHRKSLKGRHRSPAYLHQLTQLENYCQKKISLLHNTTALVPVF
ncbi:MAG: AAA family ATPase [Chitinophagaceae bacterium]